MQLSGVIDDFFQSLPSGKNNKLYSDMEKLIANWKFVVITTENLIENFQKVAIRYYVCLVNNEIIF
jgi:hypothetical protein